MLNNKLNRKEMVKISNRRKSIYERTGKDMNKEQIEQLKALERALNGSNQNLLDGLNELDEDEQEIYLLILDRLNVSIISDIDIPLLVATASNINRQNIARESLRVDGMVTKDGSRANPYVKILNDLEKQYLQLSSRLGLSPVDRVSMSRDVADGMGNSRQVIDGNKPLNDWEKFLIENNIEDK